MYSVQCGTVITVFKLLNNAIFVAENDSIVIQNYCPKSVLANVSSPYMLERLRQYLVGFSRGEELIIGYVNFNG